MSHNSILTRLGKAEVKVNELQAENKKLEQMLELQIRKKESIKLSYHILSVDMAKLQKRLRQYEKANRFVEHIDKHLQEMGLKDVVCKICDKTIDEIAAESEQDDKDE